MIVDSCAPSPYFGMPRTRTRAAVVTALVANVLVALAKLVAWLVSGSSAMLAVDDRPGGPAIEGRPALAGADPLDEGPGSDRRPARGSRGPGRDRDRGDRRRTDDPDRKRNLGRARVDPDRDPPDGDRSRGQS